MIRIKDYIFNESDVREIETHKKDLMVEFNDGYYEVVENATFDDIEWNYEQSNIKEDEYIELSKSTRFDFCRLYAFFDFCTLVGIKPYSSLIDFLIALTKSS
jgi:hypothetical protein